MDVATSGQRAQGGEKLYRVDPAGTRWNSLNATSAVADLLGHAVAFPVSPDTPGTPGLAAGLTDFKQMELDYTFTFDDVCYVIDGEIHFTPEGEETFVVRPGEIFVTRYGAKTHISVPDTCRLFWVVYPCDWTSVRDDELERMGAT